jgi:hypothetical protein
MACFAVIRISDTKPAVKSEASTADVMPPLAGQVQTMSCSESSREPQTESHLTNVTVEQNTSTAAKELEVARADAQHTPSDRAKFIGELSENEASEICSRAAVLQQNRERAKKDAEPKDAAWAYSMEMLIRQHVESQIASDEYTKLEIQCRTTFCELSIEGKEQEAQDRVSRVLQEVERQSWSDIVQWGSGGGSDQNGWHLHQEWHRPTGDEREFLFRLRNERAASAPK